MVPESPSADAADEDDPASGPSSADAAEGSAPYDPRGSTELRRSLAGLGQAFWYLSPPYLLLLLLVYLPASQNELKAAVFGANVIFIVGRIVLGWFTPQPRRLLLHRTVARWTLYYLFLGVFFTGLGVFNSNPGAWFQSMIYVVWPIMYMGLVTEVDSEQIIDRLLKIVVVGSIGVSITIIDLVLVAAGTLPEALRLPSPEDARTHLYKGYSEVASVMLATLVYAVPFLVASVMTLRKEDRFASAPLTWTALVLATLASFLGSRRAGLVTIILSPALTLYLMGRMRGPRRSVMRLVFGLGGLIGVFGIAVAILSRSIGWNVSSQAKQLQQGFAFGEGGEGTTERVEQTIALLRGWSSSSIVGHGFGAVAPGSIRNEERPWCYELQYLLLLFNTGALGFVLYSAGVVWLLWKLRALVGSGTRLGAQAVPVTVGLVSFLIANATNPYLQAYGQLWTLFLPIATVNYALSRRLV